MKARVSAQMVALAKELASYGELTESKVSYYAIWSLFLGCRGFKAIWFVYIFQSGQGALLLHIITKYSQGIWHWSMVWELSVFMMHSCIDSFDLVKWAIIIIWTSIVSIFMHRNCQSQSSFINFSMSIRFLCHSGWKEWGNVNIRVIRGSSHTSYISEYICEKFRCKLPALLIALFWV